MALPVCCPTILLLALKRPSLSFGPQGIHMTPGDRIQQRFAGIRREGLRRLPGVSSRKDLRPRPCHLRPQPAPIIGFGWPHSQGASEPIPCSEDKQSLTRPLSQLPGQHQPSPSTGTSSPSRGSLASVHRAAALSCALCPPHTTQDSKSSVDPGVLLCLLENLCDQ